MSLPPQPAPYGAWRSPLSAAAAAAASTGLGYATACDGCLYWIEARPSEGGRNVLLRDVDGAIDEPLAAAFNVRTRVHEYGGRPYVATAGAVVFAAFGDQRLRVHARGMTSERADARRVPLRRRRRGGRWADDLLGARRPHAAGRAGQRDRRARGRRTVGRPRAVRPIGLRRLPATEPRRPTGVRGVGSPQHAVGCHRAVRRARERGRTHRTRSSLPVAPGRTSRCSSRCGTTMARCTSCPTAAATGTSIAGAARASSR